MTRMSKYFRIAQTQWCFKSESYFTSCLSFPVQNLATPHGLPVFQLHITCPEEPCFPIICPCRYCPSVWGTFASQMPLPLGSLPWSSTLGTVVVWASIVPCMHICFVTCHELPGIYLLISVSPNRLHSRHSGARRARAILSKSFPD